MGTIFGRLAVAALLATTSAAFVTAITPATGAAAPLDCADGQWWDPTANICRPLGEGPQPLNCAASEWWDPTANVCRPLGEGPQPLNCADGWWWDPTTNSCTPSMLLPTL